MENLVFSANVVTPVFLVMVIGWFLKNKKILPDAFFDGASKFVFFLATPALLFSDTSKVDFNAAVDLKFLVIILSTLFFIVLIYWIIYPLFVKDRVRVGALIHCSYRSNFAILGVPLLKNMLSASGVAKAATVLAFGVPIFNVVAVVCLSYWSSAKGDYKKLFEGIIKNPLIIGCICGLLFSATGIKLPVFISKTVEYIGDTSMGLGLIVLGASFDFEKFILNLKDTAVAVAAKLVISPIIGVLSLYFFGYRGEELLIALIYMGTSSALNSYIMAKEMKSDAELTSNIVVATTGLNVITLFIGIFLVKTFLMS